MFFLGLCQMPIGVCLQPTLSGCVNGSNQVLVFVLELYNSEYSYQNGVAYLNRSTIYIFIRLIRRCAKYVSDHKSHFLDDDEETEMESVWIRGQLLVDNQK